MNTSKKLLPLSSFLILALMLSASKPASAATIFMLDITGGGARTFSDPTIWPSGIVPGTADLSVIDFGDGLTDYVYVDTAISPTTEVQRFNVGNMLSGGLEIRSGATLKTNATGTSQSNLGQNGMGRLRIKSGATLMQGGLLNVGLNNGTGTVTLESGGTHTLGAELRIGGAGTGSYNMLGGTVTIGTYLQIANTATAKGTFIQSGGTLQANRNSTTGYGFLIASTAGATGLYEISAGSVAVAATNLGFINGATNVAGGAAGTFRVVGSAASITIGSDYTQRKGAKLDLVIGASGISQINVGANALLDGIVSASFTTIPTIGQEFPIIKYTGTRTGTFATFDSLVDSPLGPDTVQLAIDYGDGSDDFVKLTVVPEPSACMLFGSLGVVLLMRKCRNSRWS